MLTFDVCQNLRFFAVVSWCEAGVKISVGHVQHGSWGEDHRPLYDVLKLTNIPGPVVLS